jgi:hypothetical protein
MQSCIFVGPYEILSLLHVWNRRSLPRVILERRGSGMLEAKTMPSDAQLHATTGALHFLREENHGILNVRRKK